MKLRPSDLSFSLGETLQSKIPDVLEMRERQGGARLEAINPEWRAAVAVTQQEGAQRILGTIGTKLGFRLEPEFEKVRKAVTNAIVKETEMINVARDGVEKMFSSFLKNTDVSIASGFMQAVPIIGTIIKYAWNVGKMVRASINEPQTTPNPVGPTTFYPPNDQAVFNQDILTPVTETRDWTNIFRPHGLGEQTGGPRGTGAFGDEYRFHVIPTTARGPNNVMIKASDARYYQIDLQHGEGISEAGGLGVIPGGFGMCIGWQSSGNSELLVQSMGEFFPTPTAEGSDLWQQVNKPSAVEMFCVSADDVANAWMTYIENLTVWLNANEEISDVVRNAIIKYVSETLGRRKQRGKGDDPYGIGDSIPVRAALVLRYNQMMALRDPVTAAYVDESFGAIKNDQGMKDLWLRQRRALVEGSPQILNVDPDMIPPGDPEFDFAVRSRLQKTSVQIQGESGLQFQGATQVAPEKKPEIEILNMEFVEPPAPTSTPSKSKTVKGSALLGLGAAAAVGYLLLRR